MILYAYLFFHPIYSYVSHPLPFTPGSSIPNLVWAFKEVNTFLHNQINSSSKSSSPKTPDYLTTDFLLSQMALKLKQKPDRRRNEELTFLFNLPVNTKNVFISSSGNVFSSVFFGAEESLKTSQLYS